MKTYSLTSPRFAGQVLFKYNFDGHLIAFEIDAELDENQRKFIYHHLPLDPSGLDALQAASKTSNIKLVPEDLSFERFYKEYGYNINKADAEKAWKKLKENDKLLALFKIKAYDAFLSRSGIGKAYPQKYLNKRYFDNNYNAL